MAGGRALAPFFFASLFVAAFSSCYSVLQVVISPLRYELGFSGNTAALIATGATVALGIPSALSFTPVDLSFGGRPFLEWVDQITGSGVGVVVGIGGAALIAWLLPRRALIEEMTSGWWQTGLVRFLPHGAIELARYIPLTALAVLAVTAIL